jgi:hypothetical protein
LTEGLLLGPKLKSGCDLEMSSLGMKADMLEILASYGGETARLHCSGARLEAECKRMRVWERNAADLHYLSRNL